MSKFNNFFGIILCLIIAVISEIIHLLPIWPFTINGSHPIEAMIIALILGIGIGNLSSFIHPFKIGAQFSTKKFLPIAIILLGSQLNLMDVMKISAQALWINLICVIFAFILTAWLCSVARIEKNLGILIAIGTAICGSTAIIVTAPVIKAKHIETVISITIITLFGLLALFAFPILGHLFHLHSWQYGVWAGTSIQAIAQVIAAGFAYSHSAGTIATIVKLVRILLLAPMLLALTIWNSRREKLLNLVKTSENKLEKITWTNYFPPFILGFIFFVILSSFGLFSDFNIAGYHVKLLVILDSIANFLFSVAMAGIGLTTDIRSFIHVGIKPFFIGFCSSIILAVMSLFLIIITT